MSLHLTSDCTDMLLDLVCYEMYSKRLSPEMQDIFGCHLLECPTCRKKVEHFRHMVGEEEVFRNFG